MKSGRGVTNGFADALRNYAGAYGEGKVAPPPPPATITRDASNVVKGNKRVPKRNATSKELHFPDFPDFKPNLTPGEVMLLGAFGGTYYRDIYSVPAKKAFNGESVFKRLPWKEFGWEQGKTISLPDKTVATATNLPSNSSNVLAKKTIFESRTMLTSPVYSTGINRFGVKCGGGLDMWESSGWINSVDPYGWYQWYCWFYLGRRTTDDKRQIQRWLNSAGPKGRFRNQLLNKCKSAKKPVTDASISPVIRQTLQHWGLEIRPGMGQ